MDTAPAHRRTGLSGAPGKRSSQAAWVNSLALHRSDFGVVFTAAPPQEVKKCKPFILQGLRTSITHTRSGVLNITPSTPCVHSGEMIGTAGQTFYQAMRIWKQSAGR